MTNDEPRIGSIIYDARKKSNLTQCQLSEKIGIAQCDISRIESGKANPSIKTISRIAAGMGMRVRIEFLKAK